MIVIPKTSVASRPQGLWQAKGKKAVLSTATPQDSESDQLTSSDLRNPATTLKRKRSPPTPDPSSTELRDFVQDWLRSGNYHPNALSDTCRSTLRTEMPADGLENNTIITCDRSDWIKLKQSFSRATEAYQSEDAAQSLALLRDVLDECHRFLSLYKDPSILFIEELPWPTDPSPIDLSPSHGHVPRREWSQKQSGRENARRPAEPLTAFHALLGSTLYYVGNLIAQDPTLAQTDEFDSAVPYWLAALDVFETGEILPCRAVPSNEPQDDWRMAIMWGRSLVSLAEEIASKSDEAKPGFLVREPKWPPNSIFTTIVSRRPPTTRRMHFLNASANDLLVLAIDQFSHGIFRMPRALHQFQAQQSVITPSLRTNSTTAFPPPVGESFSRASELFTIASDVLGVAEQLDDPAERRCWALWSDSVFSQMEMEANIDSWIEPIARARGKCWLIAGTAGIEEIEDTLEAGQDSVLSSEEAQEARESLTKAINYFERARIWAGEQSADEPLLVEALVSLANLTGDKAQREELYARAIEASNGELVLDPEDAMDVCP